MVHSEYSAYLEAIFETDDVAGRGLMELVFVDADLGTDVLVQIEAVTQACPGEYCVNSRSTSNADNRKHPAMKERGEAAGAKGGIV